MHFKIERRRDDGHCSAQRRRVEEPMNEGLLIVTAMQGNRDAFAALYMRYRDSLYRYAYFRLGSAEDAEDAVSACVAAAYENIGTLRAEGAFRAWLFRILYRCCCAVLRERIASADSEGEEALDTLPDRGDGTALSPELSEAFGILSEADREIVLLSVIAGYTSPEIAAMLSLKPSTVRSRLKRSLSKMRRFLEE